MAYSVYAILKIQDRYDLVTPEVDVISTSNSEETLKEKLIEIYEDYLAEIKYNYTVIEQESDWYKDMIRNIKNSFDGRSFIDDYGYKQFTKYILVRVN